MQRPNPFNRLMLSVKKHWKRLLTELLVVFMGAYAAFWLNDYREREHQRQLRQNYYQSFKAELEGINRFAKGTAAYCDTLHNQYSRAIARGERPQLKVHPQLDFPINMFIIRSAFNQQHFESMGSKYLASISMGSNLISLVQKRLDLFQDKSRDLMLLTASDPAVIYTATGALKPAYEWYLQDLAFVSSTAKQLTAAIEQGALPDTERLLSELDN